jgi:hypothetical protein
MFQARLEIALLLDPSAPALPAGISRVSRMTVHYAAGLRLASIRR